MVLSMTVTELIAELKRFPGDLEVQIYDDAAQEYLPFEEIEEVTRTTLDIAHD